MRARERPDRSAKKRRGSVRPWAGDAGVGLAVVLMAALTFLLDLAPGRRAVPTLEIVTAACGDDGNLLVVEALPPGPAAVAQLRACATGTLSVMIDVDPGTRARMTFVPIGSADASLDLVVTERTEWVREVDAGEAWAVGWTGDEREGRAWIVATSLEPRP